MPMKKCAMFLFALLTTFMVKAQSHDEVVKACLTLPELVNEIEEVNSFSNYQILDHGVVFDLSLNVELNGKEVVLISKDMISNQGYFLFHTLDVKGDEAHAIYRYVRSTGGNELVSRVELKLSKLNGTWNVGTYSITD